MECKKSLSPGVLHSPKKNKREQKHVTMHVFFLDSADIVKLDKETVRKLKELRSQIQLEENEKEDEKNHDDYVRSSDSVQCKKRVKVFRVLLKDFYFHILLSKLVLLLRWQLWASKLLGFSF